MMKLALPIAITFVLVTSNQLHAQTPTESPLPHRARTRTILSQLPGVAACEEMVEVSPLVSGVLAELFVEEGDWVEDGQVIASLENGVPRAALEMARATAGALGSVKAAKVDLQIAANRVRRVDRAMSRGASSNVELEGVQAELDRAIASYEIAKDSHAQSQARLEMAQAELDMYSLKAPFAGRVVHIKKKIGKTLQANEPVIRIVNMDVLLAELYLPAEISQQLKEGESYLLEADKPLNRNIESTLKFASPTIDSATRSTRCVFEIENGNLELPAGFHVVFLKDQLDPESATITSNTN